MQVEEFFHLFSGAGVESPVFGVVVGVDHGDDDALHVAAIRAGEIGAVEEIEGDGFAVGRSGCGHAGLVAGAAVVGHQQTVRAVHVDHGNHVLGAMAVDFAHQGRAGGGVAEGDFDRRSLRILPFPGAGQGFELVEGLLSGGLGKGGGCGKQQKQWNGEA